MKKIIQYISTKSTVRISIINCTTTKLQEPVYTPVVLPRHVLRETVVKQSKINLVVTRTEQKELLIKNKSIKE